MTTSALDFLEVGDKLLLAALRRILLKYLAITDDRIERGSQFVIYLAKN